MNLTKKLMLLCLWIGLFHSPQEQLQAGPYDMRNFTTEQLIACVLGGALISAVGYDLYQTYYVPREDRDETFIEGCGVVVQETREYLETPEGENVADCIGCGIAIGFVVACIQLFDAIEYRSFQSSMMKKFDTPEPEIFQTPQTSEPSNSPKVAHKAAPVERNQSEPSSNVDGFDIFYPYTIKTTFKDVAGLDDAKDSMQDIIEYLRNPEKFKRMGARAPKGILMYGGPGNGKTLLAKAVAGEVNCAFISVAGSSFIEMFAGVGAKRIRNLFDVARRQGACIIFIDEIDSLIAKRGGGHANRNGEHNQTVAAFLAAVDGLQSSTSPIIIIGATNRLDSLDRAAIRPGRFDRNVEIKKPKMCDREKLLNIDFKRICHARNLDIAKIATMTSGFSGADLSNLVNQAALLAVKDRSVCVEMRHVQKAFDAMKETMIATVDASYEIDIFYPGDMKTTFQDVAGLAGPKEDFKDIINFLKNPNSFNAMGAVIPKGVLMNGGPGNGKTLMARAVAGEANCPFISITGSSFVEKYVGTGAARIRELFAAARKEAPCIIFIDEIDALLSKRSGNASSGGDSEHNNTVAAFLAEVDGLKNSKAPVIIIGATNRLDALDSAAVRPGRFDRTVHVDNPYIADRRQLLEIKFKHIAHDSDVDINRIARATQGFSGAKLANLVNEAALLAVNEKSKLVTMNHIEQAFENITIGRENHGMEQSAEAKKITAWHEAGHVIGMLEGKLNAVHKVTIQPRGGALGYVRPMPLQEHYAITDKDMRAEIVMLFCGTIAEQKCGKGQGGGAFSDLEKARCIARDMVMKYGMSPRFLSGVDASNQDVDAEVESILAEEYKKAENLIASKIDDVAKVADLLIEKGTVQGDAIYRLLGKPEPKGIEFTLAGSK